MALNLKRTLPALMAFALVAAAAFPAIARLIQAVVPDRVILNDSRVIAVSGDYSFTPALRKKKVVNQHTYFPQVGCANVDMVLAKQKAAQVSIKKFDLTVYDCDYGNGSNDGLSGAVSGSLSLEDGEPRLRASMKLKHGTAVTLDGRGYSGYSIDATEYHPMSTFNKSRVKGGAVKKALNSNKKLYLAGSFALNPGGPLSVDLTWDGNNGHAVFTSPAWLAGKGGSAKRSGTTITIKGPNGYNISLSVKENGSGKADLGYGSFDVEPGGFQLIDD